MISARSFKTLGIAFIALGMVVYALSGDPEENLSTSLIGVICLMAGSLLYFRGRQHASRSRAVSVLGDSAPDVIYLRAFAADVSNPGRALMQGFTTDEEQLADVLRPFGDLVAIGRPGESLPPPGASRTYVSNAHWQSAVADRIAVAPLVVVRAGVGMGLLWELQHVVRNVEPARVLIWVFDLTTKDYSAFRNDAQARLGLSLPEIECFGVGDAVLNVRNRPGKVRPGFIRFTGSWDSAFMPLPRVWAQLGYNDLRKALSIALQPLFAEHGMNPRVLGRFGSQ